MASKKSSRPPIPDPYSVDYAPTGRAVCKTCERVIGDRALRLGKKVWSPWHDGFDIKFSHFRCGAKNVETLKGLKGWQALRWNDVKKVALAFGEEVDEGHEKVQKYKEWSEMSWNLKDQIMDQLNLKALIPILDANSCYYVEKKLKLPTAAGIIADGLLMGRLPPCPLCECQALSVGGPEYKCSGWISGATKCTFSYNLLQLTDPDNTAENELEVGAEELDRVGMFVLPDSAKMMPVFAKWKPPPSAPGIQRFGNPLKASASGNSGNKSVTANKREVFDSEGESETDVPKNKELCGLKFSSVGSTNPPRKELEPLIKKHGGEYSDDVGGGGFLLVGDDYKEKKKYHDAVAFGIPVLYSDFVKALVSRKCVTGSPSKSKSVKHMGPVNPDEIDPRPKGLLLRQRKYAAHYRISGKLLIPMRKVKDILQDISNTEGKGKSSGPQIRPKIIAGSALLEVDPELLARRKKLKIYVDKYRNAYNCNLHCADITTGVNKFYSLQLLTNPSSSSPRYAVLRKWGRVGAESSLTNGSLTDDYGTCLQSAIDNFEKKYQEMTRTKWEDRFEFKQQPGGYAYVELMGYLHDGDFGEGATNVKKRGKAKKEENTGDIQGEDSSDSQDKTPEAGGRKGAKAPKRVKTEKTETVKESKLDERLQELVKMIFDRDMMVEQLEQQHVNLSKMPLQSISSRQLKEGYSILQELQILLQETPSEGTIAAKRRAHKIVDATTRFYTKVPHSFTHAATPPVIDSLVKLRTKVELMEQLLDVSVASGLLDEVHLHTKEVNPLDLEYEKLDCKLEPIKQETADWNMISKMVRDSHAPSHNTYTLSVEDIFKCDAHGARSGGTHQDFTDIPNRMLLWHGSRLTNWVGILSQGLRIAPPEAPSTGYMFGKGLYFADCVSKSANYCLAGPSDPRGVLILCEVALGEQYSLLDADEKADQKVKSEGFHSTWGVGKAHPKPSDDQWLTSEYDGEKIRVPTGKFMKNTKNLDKAKAEKRNENVTEPSLLYNEYIVYKTEQVRIRYVVRLKFEFESFSFDD
eukprot:GHVQ01042854.1.p1 GENE.GHVQ01042854.1~~GHVQ01042854.1.p1  ORF type:complete len:1033 (+),score=163.60 GHVQ01042854.1:156-3254(+)